MMMSNYYNDSLLRRYTSSTYVYDTHILYDCGTNNILIPEGKSLGCIHHVVMEHFKHTSMSGRENNDNTNKSQITIIVVPSIVCLSQCMYLHTKVYIQRHAQ